MSHTITIRLSDEQYAALEARAIDGGKTIEDVVSGTIEPVMPHENREERPARFLAAMGRLNAIVERQPPITSEEFREILREGGR